MHEDGFYRAVADILLERIKEDGEFRKQFIKKFEKEAEITSGSTQHVTSL